MSIRSFLGLQAKPALPAASPETETVRKIVRALDGLEPDRARFIAAFAYILSRVARADLQVSSAETQAMERLVTDRAGLPPEQALMIVHMAKHQNLLFGATENFLVTREFGRIASRDQKLGLLDCLFAVAASEGSIRVVEENEIRQVAAELGLEHREFIAVRSRYRDHLAVLKKPE